MGAIVCICSNSLASTLSGKCEVVADFSIAQLVWLVRVIVISVMGYEAMASVTELPR